MPLIWMIQFHEVQDPIYVRALAMSNRNRKCLFVVFEMTTVPYAEETSNYLEKEAVHF